jgi:hypothetical protein
MNGVLDTAGERLAIECSLPWVGELIEEGSAGELQRIDVDDASLRVYVEAESAPFRTAGWRLLSRGAWHRNGEVVLHNVCTAGFDLHFRRRAEWTEFTYRWRPPTRDRLAARLLRSRFHLLARAVLMQYPALWWAGTRGRSPLHASACTAGNAVPLVTGPSGVGRSTLLLDELERGGAATGDNIAVGDGTTVWGLVEPVRVEGSGGRRMPHGRGEVPMRNRAAALVPDRLVVLERRPGDETSLSPCSPATAARALVTSTYMAGELRRFWAFAATLAAGSDVGPPHPPVADVAAGFAARLACFALVLGSEPPRLGETLSSIEVAAWA